MVETCIEHSGCLKDIDNIKCTAKRQQVQLDHLEDREDDIISRLNHILGGIVIASVLLIIDILTRIPAMFKI